MTYTEVLSKLTDTELCYILSVLQEYYPDHELTKFTKQELELRDLFN